VRRDRYSTNSEEAIRKIFDRFLDGLAVGSNDLLFTGFDFRDEGKTRLRKLAQSYGGTSQVG